MPVHNPKKQGTPNLQTVKLTIHMPVSELKKLRSTIATRQLAGKFFLEDRIDSLALAFVSAIEQNKDEILLKERE